MTALIYFDKENKYASQECIHVSRNVSKACLKAL